jgi:hypothetical protein
MSKFNKIKTCSKCGSDIIGKCKTKIGGLPAIVVKCTCGHEDSYFEDER